MRFRFLHIADVHLGYAQYGIAQRADDFYDAFLWAIDEAIRQKVDFVLLAGDLFHKRAIDALTLNQAFAGLSRLRDAGIPCVAVEGNHEVVYYEETVGWLQFLALQGLVVLLAATSREGKMELARWEKRRGSWFDPLPGVRIHGMRFVGAGATAAIRQYAASLAEHDTTGVEYTIFMAHTGVQGVLDTDHGSPSANEWRALNDHADYIALGHIHKPFDFDQWIYNPGSLESNSVIEYEWDKRGALLVAVDTAQDAPCHRTECIVSPKRPFVRLHVKTEAARSQAELLKLTQEVIAHALRDRDPGYGGKEPIVELLLSGNLHFDAATLDVRELAEAARSSLNALHVLVKNVTSPFLLQEQGDEDALARPQLEMQVLSNLYAADARFADNPSAWANATIHVKSLAIGGAPPVTIVEELQATIERID